VPINTIQSKQPLNEESVDLNATVQDTPELPFTLKELKEAIPSHCFQPSVWKSLSYFFLDVAIVTGLYAIAHTLDSWFFWPIFWVVQGTMFWALFVVGHDCGHRSFSQYKWLNDLIGHLAHTPILVPFHGWRISHRTHHNNTGSIDTDESWYPVAESQYREMTWYEKWLRFDLVLLLYPLYLFKRSPGKQGSHFLPNSPLFRPSEKWDVITSTICWTLMIGLLSFLTYQWGFLWLLKYYLGPYIVFVIWLDLVTFLHHTDPDIPWYRGKDWYFLKGALSTIDHDYGFINPIHHNIGTHVAHHIFLNMPHYHLKTATEAIKPILGDYYRKSNRSIFQAFWLAYQRCYFVPDRGGKVYYQNKH
jgi:omega-3 fatty acid desaturase (delta-15 desaturase)